MYDELVKRLRESKNEQCYIGCFGNCVDCQIDAELDQAADAIEKLQKPKWIPVSKRLPERPGNYLTATGNGRIIENVFMMDDSDAWQNWHPHGKWYYNEAVWDGITHWMPLPEPPKEET